MVVWTDFHVKPALVTLLQHLPWQSFVSIVLEHCSYNTALRTLPVPHQLLTDSLESCRSEATCRFGPVLICRPPEADAGQVPVIPYVCHGCCRDLLPANMSESVRYDVFIL